MPKYLLLASTACVFVAAAVPAAAQTAANGAASSDKSTVVQEVVVTAQREDQSLQITPISVASFDTTKLETAAATTTDDITFLLPGVTMQRSSGGEALSIRGIGAFGSVQRYVDGIPQIYNLSATSFADLKAVEIDKGPQGTLFGRNATGGVVQFTTRDPSETPALDVSAGYANYNAVTASLFGTAGLAKGLASDVAVYVSDQSDGWGTNFATGNPVYTSKEFEVRSKTIWEVTPTFRAVFSLDYDYNKYASGSSVSGPAVGSPVLYNEVTAKPLPIAGFYNVNADADPYASSKRAVVALRLEDDLGFARLTSITSYQHQDAYLNIDYDGTPIPFALLQRRTTSRAYTEEVQLHNEKGSPVQWVAGLFYLDANDDTDPFSFGGIIASAAFHAPAGQPFEFLFQTPFKSYAAYGQTTFPVFEGTRLTLGARYTVDKLSVSGHTAFGDQPIAGTFGGASKSYQVPTYRVSLEHDFAENVFGYASYNKGYNAGGYNTTSASGYAHGVSSVDPEKINAYEIGLKSELLEHRLRLNLAAFKYDYTNLQQQVYQSGALLTLNAAAATIKGIDADLEARPIPALTITAGLALLDSKYSDYHNAPGYFYTAAGALATSPVDATGNYTLGAARVGGNFAARYVVTTAIGDFASSIAANYTGKWYADPSNKFAEPEHTLVNLSETWTSTDGKTSLDLWAKNAGRVRYDVGINLLTPVGPVAIRGAPATYGITATRHF